MSNDQGKRLFDFIIQLGALKERLQRVDREREQVAERMSDLLRQNMRTAEQLPKDSEGFNVLGDHVAQLFEDLQKHGDSQNAAMNAILDRFEAKLNDVQATLPD
jgi:predicted nuclease with TOPRIM domain